MWVAAGRGDRPRTVETGGGLAGELTGELTGDVQRGLPATNRDGENTKMKRRPRGTHLGARKGGRGTDEGDRGGGSGGQAVLHKWGREEEWCEV
jgi:hypothetical protein